VLGGVSARMRCGARAWRSSDPPAFPASPRARGNRGKADASFTVCETDPRAAFADSATSFRELLSKEDIGSLPRDSLQLHFLRASSSRKSPTESVAQPGRLAGRPVAWAHLLPHHLRRDVQFLPHCQLPTRAPAVCCSAAASLYQQLLHPVFPTVSSRPKAFTSLVRGLSKACLHRARNASPRAEPAPQRTRAVAPPS
jgi:hypothetical protein